MAQSIRERMAETIARMSARSADPEYQRNAARWEQVERENVLNTRRAALRACGVPEEHWTRLDEPRDARATNEARTFIAGPAEFRFLVLSGPVGRGKSFALAWAVAQKGGRFVDAQDLVAASSFDREWWATLESVSVLAIDELGAEKGNDAYDANLYALLNGRFSRGRKTLIGTNLAWPAFREAYLGSGLVRLLDRFEKGGRWVNLPGESMRQHWSEVEPRGAAEGA